MLKWRLLLGTLFIGALAGLCVLDARADAPGAGAGLPGAVLMPVLLLLTALATQEVLGLAGAAGIRPVAWPIYAGNLLLVMARGCRNSICFFPVTAAGDCRKATTSFWSATARRFGQ